MKTIHYKYGILAALLLWAGMAAAQKQAMAESKEDNKIHVELRSSEDGKQKTFSKDYNSREEMLADQELKDFLNEEDLNLHFYGSGDSEDQPFAFAFPGMDSLQEFRFDGPHSFFFRHGPGSEDFIFRIPADSGVHFWLPHHPDSMFTRSLKPFQLDSIRDFWEERMGKDGSAFFFEYNDDSEGRSRLHLMGKKVTISKLAEGEEALDRNSSKKMSILAPQSISFFPNPSSGRFTLSFELELNKPVQVSIVDLSGKTLYEEEVKTFDGKYSKEFDLSERGEGIYLLQVIQGNSRLVRKILIN